MDEYDTTTEASVEFEDPVSLTSEQFFGGPTELSDQDALVDAVSTPGGFDYAANPDVKVTDVMAAREELAQMPPAPADDEDWDLDEFEHELDEEPQTDPFHGEFSAVEAIAHYTGSTPDEIYRWAANNPTLVPAAIAEVTAHHEKQRELASYAEVTRAATEAGNRPALERAEELLQGQQDAAAAEGMFADFAAAGVRPESLEQAHQLADAVYDAATNQMGYQPGPELAQACVDTVAERVAMEDRGIFFPDDGRSPRPAKLTEADFNRRWGGHLPVDERRPSVTSMFFNGGER